MRYDNFTFNGYNAIIEHTKQVFDTTKNGNFRKKPCETITENVDREFYINYVRSVSFFNGFLGGTCRAYWNYTKCGYIPTRIVTINPSRTEKHVDTFTFK